MLQPPAEHADILERARRLIPTLAARAPHTEALRRIPDETIADLRAAGLFRVVQPRRVGGAELPYELLVHISAILARGCGSTAWVYANLANHDFMLALWPGQAQHDVWSGATDQLIGSALMFPPGRATKVPEGYRLTGRWKFSSGIDACTWCMLGGIASADGELPDYRVFLVPAGEYETFDTWHAAGLRGTGSKDVAVADIFVPEHRTLAVARMKGCGAPGAALNPGALYRLPVFDMFPYVVAASALGIAQGALGFFAQETRHRVTSYSTTLMSDHSTTQLRLGEAASAVEAAELMITANCRFAMAAAEESRILTIEEKVRLRRDGAYAARLCAHAVDLLFESGGGEFLYADNPMQRAFRDVHAAQSHYALAWDIAAVTAGKALLGISPDSPTL